MREFVFLISTLSVVFLTGCSMEGISEAKVDCIAKTKKAYNIDITKSPSSWKSYAGTGGKGTTFTFSATSTAPGVVCRTSSGKVKSITKLETTNVQ